MDADGASDAKRAAVPIADQRTGAGGGAGAGAWEAERDAAVFAAVGAHDEAALRALSAQPGGFGSSEARRAAWLELLHVGALGESSRAGRSGSPDRPGTDTASASVVFTPHADEGQVALDTRRAFVTYPRGLSAGSKAAMQEDLHALICAVLQQHPRLCYFQGLHDVATVLYLTLLRRVPYPAQPGEDDKRDWDTLTQATKIVCLYRVRDAMGSGLAPMMGMLRLLRCLLAAADPQLYRLSSTISPVPTLPFFALSWILTLFSHDIDTLPPVQRIFDFLIARNPISAIYLAVAILISKRPQLLKLIREHPEANQDPSLLHPLFARLPPLFPDTPDQLEPPSASTTKAGPEKSGGASRKGEKAGTSLDEKPGVGVDEKAPLREELFVDEKAALKAELGVGVAEVVVDEKAGLRELREEVSLEEKVPTPRSRDDDEPNPFDPIPLSQVFALADALMAKYPWDGPRIRGAEVLGPGSVVRTFDWERSGRPSDSTPANAGGEDGEGVDAKEGEAGANGDDEGSSDGLRTPRAPQPFTHADAEACIDVDVILPGGDAMEDDEDLDPVLPAKLVPRHFLSSLPLMLRGSSFGTALALGIIVVGLGAVIFGWKGGRNWALWWGHVAHGWIRRQGAQTGLNRWLGLLA